MLQMIAISRSGMFHRTEEPYPPEDSYHGDDSHFSTFRSQDGAYASAYRHNSLQRQVVPLSFGSVLLWWLFA